VLALSDNEEARRDSIVDRRYSGGDIIQ
jgi:hypothetical protein